MKNELSIILDVHGNHMTSRGKSMNAHRGARHGRELSSWSPPLRSADADLLPDIKALMSRSNDLTRNNSTISGAAQIHLDNIIGSGLQLSAKPNWRLLGLSSEWAGEWSRDTEAKFKNYADDPSCFIDAARRLNFGSMIGLGYRQFLTAGDIFSQVRWIKHGNSKYSTAFQMIDPARLSNPNMKPNSSSLRGGVELDRNGAPIAYHVRQALESDFNLAGLNVYKWQRLKKETKWGRQQVIHVFEQERAGQSRGKTGLATVIAKSKMLERFQDVSLESAIINSMYAAVIESDFDYGSVMESLGQDDELMDVSDSVLDGRTDWHSKHQISLEDGSKFAQLYPGEKLNFSTLNHPGPNYADFEKSFLRNMAAGLNVTYEQLARDYSDTNYSGARAGLMESWKFFKSKRELIGGRFATLIYALWLEEAINLGEVEIPAGATDFYQAKSAWTRCKWIGPPKGHIDPLKENKSDELEMDMGTKTLEAACAERGLDWEEVLEQIAREKQKKESLRLSRSDIRGYMATESTVD